MYANPHTIFQEMVTQYTYTEDSEVQLMSCGVEPRGGQKGKWLSAAWFQDQTWSKQSEIPKALHSESTPTQFDL